ncbi:hypothetical protein WJR50_34125 [Catalinimonas sp. 4WD22]|uniref:hypothetical protein n=1 Tax=Catalinimonas locisalis TaxID=3133978 RepID=UPI0031016767
MTESVPINEVKKFLDNLPEIKERGIVNYENHKFFPWINLTLVKTATMDSWASDIEIQYVNLISVTASKRGTQADKELEEYLNLMKKIADFLKWEIVEEETEDGIENHVIYKSKVEKT